ncbi:hypothetical protein AAES_164225 [Amazona aestiva]|uniref:Uncharacterized protein n=1 Tax=Amazona aestiva TaxID=12930 RepID=A0A0Q3LTU6_AMAAE|nr:hypothetical protein AAES_164225 [Amazona aestiva]
MTNQFISQPWANASVASFSTALGLWRGHIGLCIGVGRVIQLNLKPDKLLPSVFTSQLVIAHDTLKPDIATLTLALVFIVPILFEDSLSTAGGEEEKEEKEEQEEEEEEDAAAAVRAPVTAAQLPAAGGKEMKEVVFGSSPTISRSSPFPLRRDKLPGGFLDAGIVPHCVRIWQFLTLKYVQ